MNNRISFLKSLVDIECVKFGNFTLKSGHQSPIYIDLRNIVSYPELLTNLALLFKEEINLSAQRICGVPYAALPIATMISAHTGLPMLIKRKEAKGYGTKKMLEGAYKPGDKVVLVEDVITSGQSLIETIKVLEDEGLIIEQILVVLDREQGGIEKLTNQGYNVSALFSVSSLIDLLISENKIDVETYNEVKVFLNNNHSITPIQEQTKKYFPQTHQHPTAQRLLNIANTKKSNLIASVDLTSAQDIINFLSIVGEDICAAKLHVDIIKDFSQEFIMELKSLSEKLQFLIIEDRKFADIGNTQFLQLSQGIYSIASWADMVTIHLIAGEASLKAIQDWDTAIKPALIPIIEMSSKGALTDNDYIEKCKQFLYNYADVIGAVCQNTTLKTGFLKFTPGINLSAKEDNKGQNYNSPSHAIENLQSDFLIIGRGLYLSDNPKKEIDNYLSEVRKMDFFSEIK